MTLKIYPSSAAFMVGPLVDSGKNSACFRYQWAEAHTNAPYVRRVDPAVQGLGALNEERRAAKLRRSRVKHDREVKFRVMYGDVELSGRYDFDIHYKDGSVIGELKGSTSDNVRDNVIKPKEVSPDHLAQIVFYLAILKREAGHLWVTYYQLDDKQDAFVVTHEHCFVIKLSTDGVITVDDKVYPKTLADLRRWLQGTRSALLDVSTIPAMPRQPPIEYKSPCYSCPLKAVCAEHSKNTKTAEEFLHAAEKALSEPVTPRPFKISTLRKDKETSEE